MKKSGKLAISIVLAASMILSVVSTVFADSSSDNPTIHANVDSLVYAYTIINQSDLPGTVNNGNSKITPAGLDSTKQFSGNGINIFDITTKDKVTICFNLPNYSDGWRGKIYKWYGDKWTPWRGKLIAPKGENTNYRVCDPYATNGTYALIVSYNPPK